MTGTFTGVDESPFDMSEGQHWAVEGEEEPEGGEGESPEGPAPEVLEVASAIAGEREESLRSALAGYGLSFGADGRPLIQDPARFAEWAKPVLGGSEPPAAPVPEPAPSPKQELWEMDEAALDKRIEERAKQLIQPLMEQFTSQKELLGRRWQDDAVRNAPQALAQFAPQMAYITEHPEFEAKFRQAIAGMDAQWLENPQALAATALQTAAFMDQKKMPKPETGSRADAARAALARQQPGVQQYGAEHAPAGRTDGYDPNDDLRLRFFHKFIGESSVGEQRALEAVDSRFTDIHGNPLHTLDAYKAAKAKAKARR